MKWSVTPRFQDANHEPVAQISGPNNIEARPGAVVSLNGTVSDPDQNQIKTRWWQNDAGTYPGDIAIAGSELLSASFRVPEDARDGQIIHVILEATDDGAPALTRYRRLIVTVRL